jgi:hypothetical protein
MGRLMDELFHGSRLLAFPVLALVLFTFAFVVVLIRAARRPLDADARLASLPLDDEERP